jgi:hypothetical protein
VNVWTYRFSAFKQVIDRGSFWWSHKARRQETYLQIAPRVIG